MLIVGANSAKKERKAYAVKDGIESILTIRGAMKVGHGDAAEPIRMRKERNQKKVTF